jgi:hypothetical protein
MKKRVAVAVLTACSAMAAPANAETYQFTNVTRSTGSSGTSFELVRDSENVFRGTVLICEGGCDKFPLRAVLTNNILTVSYLDQVEKFKFSNFRLYPLTQGFTTAVMFLCPGKRTTVNNYQCYNHAESKLKYSW